MKLTKPDYYESFSEAGTSNVQYLGHNLSTLFYSDYDPIDAIAENLLDLIDYQEVYLGYIPSVDQFVMGFDAWGDEENVYNVAFLSVNESGKLITVGRRMYNRMFYHEAFEALHNLHPDLIDIRLD